MSKRFLSAYTLFNFTSKWNYFEDKITNGFKPRFVLEDLSYFNINKKFAFPMLCFCDILMSNLHDHMNEYGHYGIGLKKEWGIANGLNPLLYISSENSYLLKIIQANLKELNQLKASQSCNKTIVKKLNYYSNSYLRYLKPCQGVQNKKDRYFYDEKEWRYLLPDEKNFFLDEKTFNNPIQREESNNKINNPITFEAEDIKYLIIDNVDEIDKLIKLVERKFGKESKRLITRIVLKNDIENDF
jgi:hypothetical protein